jgi:hypothetical protein
VNKLNYLYGKHSKDGLTLLELFTVISLLFVIIAVLTKWTFPKAEDLRRKDPQAALELIVRMAREVANCNAQEIQVRFIDQCMQVTINDHEADAFFRLKQPNTDCQESILNFLKAVVVSPPNVWQEYTGVTKNPFFLVTNGGGNAILYRDKVLFVEIRNPIDGQVTSGKHNAFEKGVFDSQKNWKRKGPSSPSFTVYPYGGCDRVSFKGELCPEYNKNYVVDPIAGTVSVH